MPEAAGKKLSFPKADDRGSNGEDDRGSSGGEDLLKLSAVGEVLRRATEAGSGVLSVGRWHPRPYEVGEVL